MRYHQMVKLLLCAVAIFTLQAQDSKDAGPTSLVVTYRCTPEKRTDLRNYMRQEGAQRLEGYRKNAILSGYRILLSRYVDTNNWDMMLVLTFSDYTGVEKWKRVERESPAGLPANLLPLAITLTTYPVDLVRHKAADETPLQPVYLVIPHTYTVPTPDYVQFLDNYEIPQFDGWITEGVLARYEIYLQRYQAARPWNALLFLEYKDEESLGQSETVAAKVRQGLQAYPKWRAAAGSESNFRVEREAVIADELTLPR